MKFYGVFTECSCMNHHIVVIYGYTVLCSKEVNPMKKSECTWYDRKRHFGLPISFTKYYIHEDRFFNETGFFTTKIEEILLYRIRDISLKINFKIPILNGLIELDNVLEKYFVEWLYERSS